MTRDAAPAEVTAPPHRSMVQRAPDMLVWGAVIVMLIIGFKPVDMGHVTKLFTNSENMRQFGAELLKPDFTDWKLYVAQMWLTVQIAMWGTFLAVIIAVPLAWPAPRTSRRRGSSSRCAS